VVSSLSAKSQQFSNMKNSNNNNNSSTATLSQPGLLNTVVSPTSQLQPFSTSNKSNFSATASSINSTQPGSLQSPPNNKAKPSLLSSLFRHNQSNQVQILSPNETANTIDEKLHFSDEEILNSFAEIDVDTNNFIGVRDIHKIVKQLYGANTISDELIDTMIELAENQSSEVSKFDGQLNLNQFRLMIYKILMKFNSKQINGLPPVPEHFHTKFARANKKKLMKSEPDAVYTSNVPAPPPALSQPVNSPYNQIVTGDEAAESLEESKASPPLDKRYELHKALPRLDIVIPRSLRHLPPITAYNKPNIITSPTSTKPIIITQIIHSNSNNVQQQPR
jgi:Ca2+-binding EF-hand superfamily protein